MIYISADFAVHLLHGHDRDAFHAHGRQLMDALLDLEPHNPEMIDPVTATDSGAGIVTIDMTFVVEDPTEALRLYMQIARTAIHAIGGATPEWPSDAEVTGSVAEYRRRHISIEPVPA